MNTQQTSSEQATAQKLQSACLSSIVRHCQYQLQHLWLYFKIIGATVVLIGLAACGGGGSSSSVVNQGTYYGVTGTKNGSTYTVCIDNSEFYDPNSDMGKSITKSVVNYYGMSGNINSLSGNGESCRSKFPLANVIITVSFYNSYVKGSGPTTPTPPTTPTTPTTPGTGETITTNYWRDGAGRSFTTSSTTGSQIYSYSTGAMLNGLTLTGINIYLRGSQIGYVDSGHFMYCLNKTTMVITEDSRGWTESCTQSNTNPGGSTPTTPGGSTPSTLFGSIAYGSSSAGQQVGISYNGANQTEANEKARNMCDGKGPATCGVVLDMVGRGVCGALAWGDNMAWGAATNSSANAAQVSARSGCVSRGGTNCSVAVYACNSN